MPLNASTKKTMIMRGQDIYSSQEETTSFPSSSGSEDEVRGKESSEEVYPHEGGDLLMVRRLLGGCRNLPFGGRATRDSRDACSTKGIRA